MPKIIVKKISDPEMKSFITEHILRQLPQWFGIESSLLEYVSGVKDSVFFAAYYGEEAVGFISLKCHNDHTGEIYVMGILESHHRQGIGKQLVSTCEEVLKQKNCQFFMVKTLGESHSDPHYARTRKFYRGVGFYPLEEIPVIWGEANPCLIMVKSLR